MNNDYSQLIDKYINYKPKKFFEPYVKNILKTHSLSLFKDGLYLDKIDEINLKNIKKYDSSFTSRYFYGIYKNGKGWVKYHGLDSSEFFIGISLGGEYFYDVNIGENKGVYTHLRNRLKWVSAKDEDDYGNKSEYLHNTSKLNDINELYDIISKMGATTPFMKYIIPDIKSILRGLNSEKDFFYIHLNIYKELKKNDPGVKKLRKDEDKYKNINKEYFDIYGYLPEENYKKRYDEMVDYFGKENKVLFYQKDNKLKEEIKGMLDIKKRQEIVLKEYARLFNKEKLNA